MDILSVIQTLAAPSFIISIGMAIAVYVFVNKLSNRMTDKEGYNNIKKEADLHAMREYMERQIYELNKKLMYNERRWRDVNHLVISAQDKVTEDFSPVTLNDFFKNAGITHEDLIVEKDLVFVLTPFHESYRTTYNIISEICKDVGLRCIRGDEEHVGSDILPHVLKMINRARLIIVNVDGRNPNVFYELGIAHSLNKPTIIISKTEEIPFDIRSKNIIIYNDENQLKVELAKALTKVFVKN